MSYASPPHQLKDPFAFFELWFKEACLREESYPDAMCLSTVSKEGYPHGRQVLLKYYSPEGFVFFTNTESQKGDDIRHNPHVALNFYWKSIQKQIRIQGIAHKVSDKMADEHFVRRPLESKLGAWASKQSRPLKHRNELDEAICFFASEFENDAVPRPPYWSGYRVVPHYFEFWSERPFRLHDRTLFERLDGTSSTEWKRSKLYP